MSLRVRATARSCSGVAIVGSVDVGVGWATLGDERLQAIGPVIAQARDKVTAETLTVDALRSMARSSQGSDSHDQLCAVD
jgi:hypothetical protein